MSQQVQELIDKIKNEGIEQGKHQAEQIELEARQKADEILSQAKKQAAEITVKAQAECRSKREVAHIAISQASRDMLLQLRKEIETLLNKVISIEVHKALSPESLSELIQEIIKAYLHKKETKDHQEVILTLNPHDLKKLKDGFLAKLKEKIKEPLTLRSSDDITAGFTISFDKGKSFFDFSDSALVEYLSGYLNQEVASLLKESIGKD